MIKIELTQNKYTLIDDDDYLLVSRYKWYASRCNRHWSVRTGSNKKTNYKAVYMHRLIMGAQLGQEVDHKEHYEDYIDNRKSNLRFCSHVENTHNRRKNLTYAEKKTSSQYKGVYWNKAAKKWQATIEVDKRSIHLGLFNSELEAARAYNIAAVEHFGKFAKLNRYL